MDFFPKNIILELVVNPCWETLSVNRINTWTVPYFIWRHSLHKKIKDPLFLKSSKQSHTNCRFIFLPDGCMVIQCENFPFFNKLFLLLAKSKLIFVVRTTYYFAASPFHNNKRWVFHRVNFSPMVFLVRVGLGLNQAWVLKMINGFRNLETLIFIRKSSHKIQ